MRAVLAAAMLCLAAIAPARAMDHGFDPKSPVTKWFESIMRPDMPDSRCCGASDAYKVDVLEEGGQDGRGADWIVTVTDGSAKMFPDGKRRVPIRNGTVVRVPASKVTKQRDGNPTGSAWLFMSVYEAVITTDGGYVYDPDITKNTVGTIYCLVPPPPSM